MIELMAELVPLSQQVLWAGFIVFLRVGAVIALLPVFGERTIPVRVRLSLALAFTVIIFPAVQSEIGSNSPQLGSFGVFLLTETIVGLAMGMVLRLTVLALTTAGTIAAQATSLSQLLGGAGVDPQPAMAAFLTTGGLALAAMAGLHVTAAEAMILSYEILPVSVIPNPNVVADWGVSNIAKAFEVAVVLSIPFVIASLVYNLALGVINKAMPQLMVALVGAPAITAGGLILLFLSAPVLLDIWSGWLAAIVANPFAVAP